MICALKRDGQFYLSRVIFGLFRLERVSLRWYVPFGPENFCEIRISQFNFTTLVQGQIGIELNNGLH